MTQQAILCVDDEAIILLSLVQELKNEFGGKFIYEKATSADLAFKVIEELASEGIRLILIISDWLMPGLKGDEFLDIVWRSHPDIKAIMISGHMDEAAVSRIKGNGCVVAVLKKPWNRNELKNHIISCCDGGSVPG